MSYASRITTSKLSSSITASFSKIMKRRRTELRRDYKRKRSNAIKKKRTSKKFKGSMKNYRNSS